MARIEVRAFEQGDIPEAAALFAARQARDQVRLVMLSAALAEPAACEPLAVELAASPLADGVVALRDGRMAGFLFGQRLMLPSNDFASQFVPPHSVSMPVQGHAVSPAEDPIEVYRLMYAVLAEGWVSNGFFVHRAAIVPADPVLQEAWVAIGFGRYMTAAVRPTAGPVPVTRDAGLEIHQAGAEDLDVVMRLADHLASYHTASPMFWPWIQATQPAAREFNRGMLETGDPPTYIAYRDGEPVAMRSFLRPGFIPPVVERESNVYLFEGVVDEAARTGGVGASLLAYSIGEARARGDRWCTLHFASGNPTGGPFWLAQGFVPVEYTMERRIDERVAWAKG